MHVSCKLKYIKVQITAIHPEAVLFDLFTEMFTIQVSMHVKNKSKASKCAGRIGLLGRTTIFKKKRTIITEKRKDKEIFQRSTVEKKEQKGKMKTGQIWESRQRKKEVNHVEEDISGYHKKVKVKSAIQPRPLKNKSEHGHVDF